MNDNITTGSNLYLNSVKNIMEKEYNQKFIELILDIFFMILILIVILNDYLLILTVMEELTIFFSLLIITFY